MPEYRMNRRYKTRYFAPTYIYVNNNFRYRKMKNTINPKQTGLFIQNASDCDSMNDFAEIPQRHHPGNHLGQKGWVSRYYA
jgi:hypothetical protein